MLLLLRLKEKKWKAASLICDRICGNEFREVDFNKDTSMTLSFPIHFEWLWHWHLFHLMKPKFVLNNTVIMLETIKSLIILRIPTLVGFVETHLEGHLFLHRHYVTCFIEKLIQEQRLHRVSLLQVFGGQPAPPAWRQYFDANQRLIRIVDNFPNLDAMQYLRSIAYNNPLLLIHSFLINNYLIRKRGLDCQN